MKDLAVLIPAYNDTPALLETLDSICETDNSFTVVIVDDGSRDPIEIDTDAYPFAIDLLRQTPNGGIVKALNLGLQHIRERGFAYIARLDAADLNRPDRFRIQYEHLKANPRLSLLGSNVVFREEESRNALFTTNLPLTSDDTKRWIVFRNCFIHPAVMFRTEVLEESGLYDAKFPHIEDYVLFSRIVKHHHAENLEQPLVDCFVREGGISLRNQRTQLLSGFRFKLSEPRPFDPLWYAFLTKRLGYLILPHRLRTWLKTKLGFAKAPGSNHSPATPAQDPT